MGLSAINSTKPSWMNLPSTPYRASYFLSVLYIFLLAASNIFLQATLLSTLRYQVYLMFSENSKIGYPWLIDAEMEAYQFIIIRFCRSTSPSRILSISRPCFVFLGVLGVSCPASSLVSTYLCFWRRPAWLAHRTLHQHCCWALSPSVKLALGCSSCKGHTSLPLEEICQMALSLQEPGRGSDPAASW